MVFVKVRETYDLHTVRNKMTVISIHTPKPEIIKANFPGLLMQCKTYRPFSADVRIACASMQPLDPLGVGTAEGDVAPEDVFNPILYKACSNYGMSQIEARINLLSSQGVTTGNDVVGQSADIDVDSFTNLADEFPLYYGLLSNAHEWKHANPQAGLSMSGLRPLVHEMVYNVGDTSGALPVQSEDTKAVNFAPGAPLDTGYASTIPVKAILGGSKPMPMINCTSYNNANLPAGFSYETIGPGNCESVVPYFNVVVGCIIVPPSRLHELFYRMVVEWTLEFSSIRPIGEITNWAGLSALAGITHYQNYDYSVTKKALTGTSDTILDNDACMVSANVDVKKVM